jgi:hypothetical protein
MSTLIFEPQSFMTERERSTNWAIKHWHLKISSSVGLILATLKWKDQPTKHMCVHFPKYSTRLLDNLFDGRKRSETRCFLNVILVVKLFALLLETVLILVYA